MAQAAEIFFWTCIKSTVDLSTNVVVSALVEAIFPEFDETKNVWLGGFEAFLEIGFFLLLSSKIAESLSEGLSGYGFAAVPYGTLLGIFLLENAYRKLLRLQGRISDGLYDRRCSKEQEKVAIDHEDSEEEDE